MTPISDRQQRYVVVTGAASGIGRAVAGMFAESGATVGLLDVDEARAREVADVVGSGAVAVAADVSDRHQVDAAFAALPFPDIDVLVNNAGIREITTFEELSHDDWDRIIGIDLSGAFYCCKAAYPRLRKPGGSIVNISSVAGLVGIPKRVAYSAAKHGLIGLTRGLADDLGSVGIRINAVCPGVTETPMTASYFDDPDLAADLRRVTPLGRWGRPADIAALVGFLAGDTAGFCTGGVYPVDGGYTASKGFGTGGAR